MEDEGRDRGRKRRKGKEHRGGKWKGEDDHGCHAVSYSICCSAEQSGAAGGGQASAHRGGGEGKRLRERGGGGNQLGTSPPLGREAQRDRPRRRHSLSQTLSERRSEERPGQRVEVKKGSKCGRGVWCTPAG